MKRTIELLCRAHGLLLPVVEEQTLMNAIVKHCKIPCTALSFWLDAVKEPNSQYYVWGNGAVFDQKDPIWWSKGTWKAELPKKDMCVAVFCWHNVLGLNNIRCNAN